MEDLRILKLILHLFSSLSSLEVNFHKRCPNYVKSLTLSCAAGQLPVPYLGILSSGRPALKQDWIRLTNTTSNCLLSWKTHFLSLGGHLMLVNSVLSSIPMYWMAMFELPRWVILQIGRIRRDFLWSGRNLTKPKCKLMMWPHICKSKDQGGWGTVNFRYFNYALLGKWWWKITSGYKSC